MRDLVDYVGALVRLSDGRIVGKTRLQKIAYLLEAKELGFGLSFDYHNFGPFSSDLAFAVDDAESLGYVVTEERFGFHSVPYTIFSSADVAPEFEDGNDLEARRAALKTINDYSALLLELTATAVYLKRNGYPKAVWKEVKKRKQIKATAGRIDAAQKLIRSLGL